MYLFLCFCNSFHWNVYLVSIHCVYTSIDSGLSMIQASYHILPYRYIDKYIYALTCNRCHY